MRSLLLFSFLFLAGCSKAPPQAANSAAIAAADKALKERTIPAHHPNFDIAYWSEIFPLAEFEKEEGRRRFDSTEPDDPLDLWKARGRIISSPPDLAMTEQVRSRASKSKDLGKAVPIDTFLWAVGAPKHPYLT